MELRGVVFLLLVTTTVIIPNTYADKWTWGADKDEVSEITDETASQLAAQSENANDTQANEREPRFLGIGDKLCALGIGSNCEKKSYTPTVESHYGPPPVLPSHSISSYATLNYDNVKGPGYPAAVSPGAASAFDPKPFFVAPAPYPSKSNIKPHVDTSHSQYTPPKVISDYKPPLPTHTGIHKSQDTITNVVKHIHTHTHVHQGINGATSFNSNGPQTGFVGQNGGIPELKPAVVQAFQPSGHQPSVSQSFQPTGHLPAPSIEIETPGHHGNCQCVPSAYCSFEDIVARNGQLDISSLIDARSRKSDILSNATDILDEELITTEIPEDYTTTESSAQLEKVLAMPLVEEARQKRDLQSGYHIQHHDQIPSDTQERQFPGNFPGLPGSSICGIDQVCCRKPLNSQAREQFTCGQTNAAGLLGRVKNPHYVDGDAEFAEYPWQAAILKQDRGDKVYVCGATLISDRHLLTAAHCINSLQSIPLTVRLGEWDVSAETEFYKHLDAHVAGIHIHPEYYAGNLQNDIAVLSLHHPIDFTTNPHISPVCLPDQYSKFIGQRCYATGWGKDAFGTEGNFQRVLKEVEIPVISHHQCQTALRHTHLGATFTLHEGNICAGGEKDRDTCKGDGGGPLVCPGQNGNAQLAGLVSWGIGCGKVGVPGVYVNVAHYLQWIQTVIYQGGL